MLILELFGGRRWSTPLKQHRLQFSRNHRSKNNKCVMMVLYMKNATHTHTHHVTILDPILQTHCGAGC